jgi:predicted ATP-grasp superfamily ATP-dependent carboligase
MRILLLDTNVSSYPIYEYLISEGYEVFVAGINPNDSLALRSENYLHIDYSKLEEVEKVYKNYKIDLVVPGCNDVSYKISSLVAQKYNLPLNIDPPKVNSIINEKDKFKNFALEIGLNVPQPVEINNLSDCEYEKVIVKPTDSFSGKGITILSKNNFDKIELAIIEAINNSNSQSYIIEEYFEGQLYSHSAFIENGSIVQDFIVEEHCFNYQFAVDTSWLIPNNEFVNLELIREQIQKIVNALDLCKGLIHTQFIMDKNTIKILEVTRRCPGDLYSLLIEHSTGIKYAQRYINYILKINTSSEKKLTLKKYIRQTVFSSNNVYATLNFISNSKDQEILFYPLEKAGFKNNHGKNKRTGILFFGLDD